MAIKKIATKHNNLVDAGFFKRLNGMEMRIVNLAIAHINPKRSFSQNRKFEFSVKEFLEFNSGITDQIHAYENVRKAVKNLSSIWVEVEPLAGYDITEISLLTDRSYSKGKGRFMIEFHEKAMPYLAEIKNNYTSILLEIFGALKSEYSLKLYEIFSRWGFNGSVTFSFKEMRNLLNIEEKYDRYNNFNQWVLRPALKEINAKTNLSVTVKPIRTGRAITDLEFSIFDKSQAIPVEIKRQNLPQRPQVKAGTHEEGVWARKCESIIREYWQGVYDGQNWREILEKLPDSELELLQKYYKIVGDDYHKICERILKL